MNDNPTAATGPATSADLRPATPGPATSGPDEAAQVLVEDDLLVEEVSIDGMCGVY